MNPKLALLATLLLLATPAQAVETEQQWTHPKPSNVEGFTLHLRHAPTGEFTEQRDLGPVSHELVDGVATYSAVIDVGELPAWGALRAYNELGESDFSNEKLFAVPAPPQWAEVSVALVVLALLAMGRRGR